MATHETEIPFNTGQQIIDKNDPASIGIYTGRSKPAGTAVMVEIRYPNGATRFRPLAILEALDPNTMKGLKEQFEARRFGKNIDLKRLITYEKLKGTLQEVIYSMEAAQIDFYPYQFKPVLKFINSPTERLVLADEVGLGKTIECALIWMEMQARYRSSRLLIVCPNILAAKWRDELYTKFQIDAQIVGFEGLREAITRVRKENGAFPFALIGTYTGLRPPKLDRSELKAPPEDNPSKSGKTQLLRELRYWEEEYPPFDLVIFDEAHYMRNQATTTYHLGENLSANARAVLCVSATPVNNSNIDLHSLLKIIDEDFFATQSIFDELIEINKPAVRAANALCQVPINTELLRESTIGMSQSSYIKNSPLFAQFLQQLSDLESKNFQDIDALAKCQDTVEKLNILGSYINRTRRVQVKENRPERNPSVLSIDLTNEEMELYQTILKIVRRKCKENKTPFHVFQVMGLQLMASSCIPAFCERMKVYGYELEKNIIDEAIGDTDTEEDYKHSGIDISSQISHLLNHDFEGNDSKFHHLKQVLDTQKNEKIIIFSYFRSTLAYLKRRISKLGEDVAVIHGDIDTRQRWDEIERFREQAGPRILLASEVGSEGIDLQFCRVLVNYDLPWNPMRIEQRIGRIDRVGQKADKLSIINFKIANTLEERIYDKLHEKLEKFSNSLGDLDEMIGREVKQLTIELLTEELSPEEEEKRIAQTQNALANQLIHISTLEESSEALIAFSDYVQRKVEENHGKGRYIQSAELENYLSDFFDRNFKGTEIDYNAPSNGCLRIRLSQDARESLDAFIRGDNTIAAKNLRRKDLIITFARNTMTNLSQRERSRVVFVNHLSPLIRWITKTNNERESEFYKLSAVSLKSKHCSVGTYIYRVERWIMNGAKKTERLSYGIINIETLETLSSTDSERIIQEMLSSGEDWTHRSYSSPNALIAFDKLEDHMSALFDADFTQFEIENESTIQIKTQRASSIFDRRIEQDARRLDTLSCSAKEDRLIRMAKGRLDKAIESKKQSIEKIMKNAHVQPETETVAVGILNIMY